MAANPQDQPGFCIAPWTALYLQNNAAASPCCHFGRTGSLGNLHEQAPEELWNSAEMRQLRIDMLSGEREIPNCADCRRMERAGEKSLRQDMMRMHGGHLDLVRATRPDGSVENFDPVSLTVSTGDHCQLRCLMCVPFCSSAWKKELGIPADTDALGPVAQDRIRSIVAQGTRLERILFMGGEPLISALHYEILDLLLERRLQEKIEVFYNTNLFQLRWTSKNALDYWKRFPKVTLYVSVDGTGEKFGEIRRGHSWSRLLKNLSEVRERVPHVETFAFLTLSTFNFLDVPDVLRTLLEESLFPMDRILFNFVREPLHANAQSAPPEQKKEARERYILFMKELLTKYDATVAAHLLALLRVSLRFIDEPAHLQNR